MTSSTLKNKSGVVDRGHVEPRQTTETKAAFKTTELVVYIAAVIGVIITAMLVRHTSGHNDYFRADKAAFYVVLLTIGYLASRGLAKSGSREHYDAPRSD